MVSCSGVVVAPAPEDGGPDAWHNMARRAIAFERLDAAPDHFPAGPKVPGPDCVGECAKRPQ